MTTIHSFIGARDADSQAKLPALQDNIPKGLGLQPVRQIFQGRNTLAPQGTPDLAAIQRQHWLDPRCPARGEKRCQYADGDEHDCAAAV